MNLDDPFSLNGRSVILGVTRRDDDGGDERLEQHFGSLRIVPSQINHNGQARDWPMIVVNVDGKSVFTAPYDERLFTIAQKGTYRLRNNGEEIVDPDLICQCTITKPALGRG